MPGAKKGKASKKEGKGKEPKTETEEKAADASPVPPSRRFFTVVVF